MSCPELKFTNTNIEQSCASLHAHLVNHESQTLLLPYAADSNRGPYATSIDKTYRHVSCKIIVQGCAPLPRFLHRDSGVHPQKYAQRISMISDRRDEPGIDANSYRVRQHHLNLCRVANSNSLWCL